MLLRVAGAAHVPCPNDIVDAAGEDDAVIGADCDGCDLIGALELQRLAPLSGVPHADAAVVAAADKQGLVAAGGDGVDDLGVALVHALARAAAGVPQSKGAVRGCRRQQRPVV